MCKRGKYSVANGKKRNIFSGKSEKEENIQWKMGKRKTFCGKSEKKKEIFCGQKIGKKKEVF